MVRLNTVNSYIVGINCNQLADKSLFTKKMKKIKCGLCSGCELSENCGACNSCLKKNKRTQCAKRKCTNVSIHILNLDLHIYLRDHSYITSALVGREEGEVRKCQFLLILSSYGTVVRDFESEAKTRCNFQFR